MDGRSRSRANEAKEPAPAAELLRAAQEEEDTEEDVHFPWRAGMVLDCRYQLQELLGDGAFGRVLKARDLQEDRDVALKVIRDVERYRENAEIEANILLDLRVADPENVSNCLRLYNAFLHNDAYYCLVCELLGESLYDFLKLNGYRGYWLQDIQAFTIQSLQALKFIHGLTLTHTDLKPENILLQTREVPRVSTFPRGDLQPPSPRYANLPYVRPFTNLVKLVDFGSATYVDMHHSSVIQTRQYRSPEVILHMGWSDKADLWSLGCILWELYSGSMLFETHNSEEHLALMERIIGNFPDSMLVRASEKAKARFLSEGRLRWPENAESEESVMNVHRQWPLADRVPPEHLDFVHFLSGLLSLDPSRREIPSSKFLSLEYRE